MGKSWTRVRNERTWEFGRDFLVQIFLTLLFGSAGALCLVVCAVEAPHNLLYLLLTPVVYLTTIYTGRAFLKARFTVSEWKRWREFLKELDAIQTVDTTFKTHDL